MKIMNRTWTVAFLIGSIAGVAWPGRAAGQTGELLHRQAPGRVFGQASDTAFINDFGQQTSALYADRFNLPDSRPICRVVAFAFFGGSSPFMDPPQPTHESIRVRVYDQSGGAPGSILYERTLQDPPRPWTGSYISLDPSREEYRYELRLDSCFTPAPGIDYWVEVAQIGDPNSVFRWETSSLGGDRARQFPVGTPWVVITDVPQLAYELWTPEPSSGLLTLLAVCIARRRGRRC